jgi:hypothetical protein
MNREQAVRIQEHILDAHVALDDARMAIAGLGKEERLRFDGLLWEVVADLQQKLLAPIHDQFPDIEPPLLDEQVATISSELSWDQARLPSSMTESDLDDIIFPILRPIWQKTAKVVIQALQRCKALELPVGDEAIAARLQVLSDADRIEGIGDLRMWFHSEVRLKD